MKILHRDFSEYCHTAAICIVSPRNLIQCPTLNHNDRFTFSITAQSEKINGEKTFACQRVAKSLAERLA
jgi:hypothetical protein